MQNLSLVDNKRSDQRKMNAGSGPLMPRVTLVSVEVTRLCAKACWFCYNHSGPHSDVAWSKEDFLDFAIDCAANGVKSVSLGGGEPTQWPHLYEVLTALDGVLNRTVTTNGTTFDECGSQLIAARPDKVHVSVHFPEDGEVHRAVSVVRRLGEAGIAAGVNLLVRRSKIAMTSVAAKQLVDAGIGNDRIVYLPMRGTDTPSPEDVAAVAGRRDFQSTSCLSECGWSDRFVSVGADKTVGWCSYTSSRQAMAVFTYDGMIAAVGGMDLRFCGGK